MKIKPTSEAEHRFCLWLCRLRSSENWIVIVRSRIINQSQSSIPGLVICWFFCFYFRLRQSSFHWIISDGVINGIRRNENVLILPTPILSSLWLRYDPDFRFSLDHKRSYDSDYDSVTGARRLVPVSNTFSSFFRVNLSRGRIPSCTFMITGQGEFVCLFLWPVNNLLSGVV